MHVLLLASWWRTPRHPQVGAFFEDQARMLQRRGIRVGLLHPVLFPFSARFDGLAEVQPPDELDSDLPVVRAFATAPLPRVRALRMRRLHARVEEAYDRHVARHGAPDLLHAHATFQGGVAARELARRRGLPYVLTEHATSLVVGGGLPHAADRRAFREVVRDARRAIVVSHAFADDLSRTFGMDRSAFDVVPNVVDPSFVDPAPIAAGPPIVLTTCFLSERKRVDLLLAALATLRGQVPGIRLRVAGDGPDRGRLEGLAREHGVADAVDFLGDVTRARIREELGRCAVFALASDYETFGVVLIEALARGRPVVTTDSGGPRDIVGPGDGVIVPRGDAGALARAIGELLATRDRHDPRDLSRRCDERFGEPVVARALLALYDDAGLRA